MQRNGVVGQRWQIQGHLTAQWSLLHPSFKQVSPYKNLIYKNSGQYEGIGRNASLPHTTKRRITTNLKTTNKQNCQKIKLCGTLTTMELKKHSLRTIRGMEMGSWTERTHSKAADRTGEAGSGWPENERLKTSGCGILWGLQRWEQLPVSQDSSLESGVRAERDDSIVSSLTPPSQTAPQCSKEGCPDLVNT